MDYFSIIVLVMVVFVFMGDRNIKPIEIIQKENKNILNEAEEIKKNLDIIKLKTEEMNYKTIENIYR